MSKVLKSLFLVALMWDFVIAPVSEDILVKHLKHPEKVPEGDTAKRTTFCRKKDAKSAQKFQISLRFVRDANSTTEPGCKVVFHKVPKDVTNVQGQYTGDTKMIVTGTISKEWKDANGKKVLGVTFPAEYHKVDNNAPDEKFFYVIQLEQTGVEPVSLSFVHICRWSFAAVSKGATEWLELADDFQKQVVNACGVNVEVALEKISK